MKLITTTFQEKKCVLKYHMDQFRVHYFSTFIFLAFFLRLWKQPNTSSAVNSANLKTTKMRNNKKESYLFLSPELKN